MEDDEDVLQLDFSSILYSNSSYRTDIGRLTVLHSLVSFRNDLSNTFKPKFREAVTGDVGNRVVENAVYRFRDQRE